MPVPENDPRTHAIVFDWHGVLDFTTLSGLNDRLSEVAQVPAERVREVLHPMLDAYTIGRIDPGTFWTQVERRWQLTSTQAQAVRGYLLTVQRNDALWSLLPGWKQRFRLGVLSDSPLDKMGVVRETQDLSVFDAVHFSSEQHARKVSDEFFYGLLRELRCIPARTLYVDDRARNIAFAKNLGFPTVAYTTVTDLERAVGTFAAKAAA